MFLCGGDETDGVAHTTRGHDLARHGTCRIKLEEDKGRKPPPSSEVRGSHTTAALDGQMQIGGGYSVRVLVG
jgi:hypothetical protein